MIRRLPFCVLLALAACHKGSSNNPADYGTPGTQVAFDLTADLTVNAN